MKSLHQRRVERFLLGAGHQAIPARPTIPDLRTRLLQATLILEEALELVRALGFDAQTPVNDDGEWRELTGTGNSIQLVEVREPNLIDIIHEAGDCEIVATGTLSLCGVHDDSLMEEMDGNNLMKVATGYVRADGKLCKHRDHPKPAIWRTIWQQNLDAKFTFEVSFESHLRDLLGPRLERINRDCWWLFVQTAFKQGLTPPEAAAVFLKKTLVEDLETIDESPDRTEILGLVTE